MKITYICQYFNIPSIDGGSTRPYEMAKRLAKFGHDITIVTSKKDPSPDTGSEWESLNVDGFKVMRFPVPYSNEMSFPRRVIAFVNFAFRASFMARRLPADLVFATSTPLTIAIPGFLAARHNHCPMVFEVRDLWPEMPVAVGAVKNPILKFLAKALELWAYKNSRKIIALSPGMQDGVVECGYPISETHIIPNGSDVREFQSIDQEISPLERLSLPSTKPLIIYTGAFGLVNGVDYLAHIARVFHESGYPGIFLAIGEGKDKEKVQNLANSWGIAEVNFFVRDRVSKKQIAGVYAAATLSTSLFVDIPEMWKNSANKFFDGLASGKPIAINHEGWIADLIREKEAGIVLDKSNYEKAAGELNALLCDHQRLATMQQNALQLASQEFSRDLLAEKLHLALKEVILQPSLRPGKDIGILSQAFRWTVSSQNQ